MCSLDSSWLKYIWKISSCTSITLLNLAAPHFKNLFISYCAHHLAPHSTLKRISLSDSSKKSYPESTRGLAHHLVLLGTGMGCSAEQIGELACVSCTELYAIMKDSIWIARTQIFIQRALGWVLCTLSYCKILQGHGFSWCHP